MNLGPEFYVFGESVPGKMPSPVFEYRFPEKKMCVPGAALPSPEAEEAGADELLTVERAVSYTHLDVYKRQILFRGLFCQVGEPG